MQRALKTVQRVGGQVAARVPLIRSRAVYRQLARQAPRTLERASTITGTMRTALTSRIPRGVRSVPSGASSVIKKAHHQSEVDYHEQVHQLHFIQLGQCDECR